MDEPSNSTLSHSIAIRKETTSRPEMTPMKMERRRNKRSWRLCGSADTESSDSGLLLMTGLLCVPGGSRQQQEQRIVAGGRAAAPAGCDFGVPDQLQDCFLPVGIAAQCRSSDRCVGTGPASRKISRNRGTIAHALFRNRPSRENPIHPFA